MGRHKRDISGMTFGRLLVISYAGLNHRGGNAMWLCKCSCGVEKEIMGYRLTKGIIKSCGCFSRENRGLFARTHGLTKHPLFSVWRNMKYRCYDKNHISYPNYGGKGVVICKEWLDSFFSFYSWAIDNGWEKGLQIDKDIISKQLGVSPLLYSPEMCCFVTPYINSINRITTIFITYMGEVKCLKEWCDIFDIAYSTARNIMQKGNKPFDYVVKKHSRLNKNR